MARTTRKIDSVTEHEEYPGQTLVTRSHDVIRQWVSERDATPCTAPGSEHQGHPGVLRFDFPGYGGQGLQRISWDDWFSAFDSRGLDFVYQEHKSDGAQSNFFRLTNPDGDDG